MSQRPAPLPDASPVTPETPLLVGLAGVHNGELVAAAVPADFEDEDAA